jgi:tripartite-type tricarboxylate transporter receptor subunit TctC
MKHAVLVGIVLTMTALTALAPKVAVAQSGKAASQADDPFYRTRNLTLIVGADGGGGYNVYSRLMSRFMARYLPGDTSVIMQTMPGASGRRAAEYLYNAAPQDGSTFGTLEQNIPLTQLMSRDDLHFDIARFNYLGNVASTVSVAVTWHKTGIETLDDAKNNEVIVGATGQTGTTELFARMMNRTLGTRFRIVNGYPGGNEINLAMERGEVGGRTSYSWSSLKSINPDWVAQKKVNILVQIGLHKDADLPDVPLLLDIVKAGPDREAVRLLSSSLELGRVYLAPPNVPAERIAILRKAFAGAVADPLFLQEAKRLNLDVNPADGATVQNLVETLAAEPPEAIDRARSFIQ